MEDEFWHELVLNGVGGRTIAEAKERMSLAEFESWWAYRQRRGVLNIGLNVERSVAVLSSLYAQTITKRPVRFCEFAPHFDQPKATFDDTDEQWEA